MEALKRNRIIILFLISMIILILLAYWVSEELISHIDRKIPEIG